MSSIESFFKQNSGPKDSKLYVASQRFRDKDGKPIKWELKQIPNKQMEAIKTRTRFYTDEDSRMGRFAIEATVASVAFPPLRDKALQDSYGVKDPEDLLYALLTPAELDLLKVEIFDLYGYNDSINDLAGEVKNS